MTVSTSGPPATVMPGDSKCYQYWYRNPGTSLCGSNFNPSSAIEIKWI